MGEGNWLPPHSDAAHYATIEPENIYGEFDMNTGKYEVQEDPQDWDATSAAFQERKAEIITLLPKSYGPPEREWLPYPWRNCCVWAVTDLAMLVTYEDTYSRLHFALTPRHDPGDRLWWLACHHVDQIGPRFLNQVHEIAGPLTVRSGAWTSREYQPTAA